MRNTPTDVGFLHARLQRQEVEAQEIRVAKSFFRLRAEDYTWDHFMEFVEQAVARDASHCEPSKPPRPPAGWMKSDAQWYALRKSKNAGVALAMRLLPCALLMARYADPSIIISITALAKQLRRSPSVVRGYLGELVRLGWLICTYRSLGRGPSVYVIGPMYPETKDRAALSYPETLSLAQTKCRQKRELIESRQPQPATRRRADG